MNKKLSLKENEINFIYLNKCYPVNLSLFNKHSNFFLRKNQIKGNIEPIKLFDEFNSNESYSEESIISFLGYFQDQPIKLTFNNVIAIKTLSTKYFVDQLTKDCDQYIEEHYHEIIDYFLSSKIYSSEIYEHLISTHLIEYINNDLLYDLPTSTLHRIQQYYLHDVNNSKQKSKIIVDFLIATVSKKNVESSIFISSMKFNREEILYIKEQMENIEDHYTKNILTKFLFENPSFINEYIKNEAFEKQEQAKQYEKQIEKLRKEGENKEREYNEKFNNLIQTFENEINQINNQLSLIFCNIDFKKPINLPNSATKVYENQFKNLPIQEIILPDNVTNIENKAFYNCSSLKKITIPLSVKTIGSKSFYGCSSLIEIEIPSSVEIIGDNCFEGCINLNKVTIDPSRTKINANSFYGASFYELMISNEKNNINNNEGSIFYNTNISEDFFNEQDFDIQISIIYIIEQMKNNERNSNIKHIKRSFVYFSNQLIQAGINKEYSKFVKLLYKNNHYIIYINLNMTEILHSNNALCTSDFYSQLALYSNIFLEIQYPNNFDDIYNLTQNDKSINNKLKIILLIKKDEESYSEILKDKNINIIKVCTNAKTFGKGTFFRCSSLVEISIPLSVTSIGECSFYDCSSLRQITIPSSVISIGECSFCDCSSLEQITIPSSVNSIGECSFSNCTSLKQITIPSSVTSIGGFSFSNCTSLKQIIIPSSVTSIGEYSFSNCSSLESISILSSIVSIENHTFNKCTSLTQISIPSSVKSIKKFAFFECTSLAKVSMSSSITYIGIYAFSCCLSLTQITLNSIDNQLNHSIKRDDRLNYSSLNENIIDSWAFANCPLLNQISIPTSINIIKSLAFIDCLSLTQLTIPPSVTLINDLAFDGCESLQQITIPSITKIGNGIFRGCQKIEKITILPGKNPVLKYYKNKYFLCKSNDYDEVFDTLLWIKPNVRILTLPPFIKIIGEHAFYNNSLLEHIQIPSSTISIKCYAFRSCKSLKKIVIPSSVTSIENSAFQDCTSLKEVVIYSSITSIKSFTFCGCFSLEKISIPSSVETIQNAAFAECSSLEYILIPNSVTSIYDFAFDKCSSLKQISIPSSVTSIGYKCFSECYSLSKIMIPSSIKYIDKHAFDKCQPSIVKKSI